MRKIFSTLLIGGTILWMPAVAAPQDGNPDIRVTAGRLTVHADNMTMSDLLLAIGREVGFYVSFCAPLSGGPTSWRLTDVPLALGIQRIVGNDLMIFIDPSSPSERNFDRTTPALWVCDAKAAPAAVPSVPPLPAMLTKSTVKPAGNIAELERLVRAQDGGAAEAVGKFLSGTTDPNLRDKALTVAEQLSEQDTVKALSLAAANPDPVARLDMINALSRYTSPQASAALGQTYFTEHDPGLRRSIVEAMAAQHTETARALIRQALNDVDDAVRATAKSALAADK